MGFWNKLGKWVYGIVGATAVLSLLWAIYWILKGTFFSTMGFLGSLAFFILIIGGLNWGLRLIKGTDLFGN